MEVRLPVTFERPVPGSDALWDLHIQHQRWLNFVGGSILAAEALFSPKSVGTIHRASLKVRTLPKHTEDVPVPDIEVVKGEWDTLVHELPRQLYYAAFVQLATGYEDFLGMLLEDILWRNPDLLAADERQLTTREILAFSDL
jgi:hypothetical protein